MDRLRRAKQGRGRRRTQSTRGRARKSGDARALSYAAMTRQEIERALIGIVREEKDIPEERLALSTPLAEAGIGSRDPLTLLFPIAGQIHISLPHDKAPA